VPSQSPLSIRVPVALATIEVEVDDLSQDTIAAVTPALVLAAHGLERELNLNHQPRNSGAADIAGDRLLPIDSAAERATSAAHHCNDHRPHRTSAKPLPDDHSPTTPPFKFTTPNDAAGSAGYSASTSRSPAMCGVRAPTSSR